MVVVATAFAGVLTSVITYLKEKAGLKYKEIGEIEIFGDLSFVSLRSIYRNMKRKFSNM